MSLFVNTNISSLTAQRSMISSSNDLDTAFQRLSSGLRINSAADDAAGLQIATKMETQIQGLNQAVRNANDGISLAQVAEGAMQESVNILQRMRVLTVQSQNGANSTEDLESIQFEITQLRAELTRIADTTEFNNVPVLQGDYQASFLVGANAGQDVVIDLQHTHVDGDPGFGYDGLFGNFDLDLTNDASQGPGLQAIDTAINTVNQFRAGLGAAQNRFDSTIRNLTNVSENTSAAKARIMDTDFASETARMTRAQILQQASISVLSQANQRPQAALSLLQG